VYKQMLSYRSALRTAIGPAAIARWSSAASAESASCRPMQLASISGVTKTGACVRTARFSASLDRASTSHAVAALDGITGAHVDWAGSKGLDEWERKAL
jgi:hypothetical protein